MHFFLEKAQKICQKKKELEKNAAAAAGASHLISFSVTSSSSGQCFGRCEIYDNEITNRSSPDRVTGIDAVELNRDSTGQMQRIIALGAMIRLNAGTQDLTSPLPCANFVLTKARARQLLQRDFLVLMKTEQ